MKNITKLQPAPIRAALALLDASVPRTAGVDYHDLHSETFGDMLLIGYEADREEANILEVWLRGVSIGEHLDRPTYQALRSELEASLLEDAAEARDDMAISAHQERALAHYTAQAALIPMMGLRA